MQKYELKIVEVPIDDLLPSDYNPRRWDELALKGLSESIIEFGLVDPIIVNGAPSRFNIVIGGHMRLHVVKLLGFKTVPVLYLNIPDIEKEKELNLRLNKNVGAWDFELLQKMDLDLLLDVGFTETEMAEVWDRALETEDDHFDVEKEKEKIKETAIKPGDIFQLGQHRLVCGDSTNPDMINKLLADKKAAMLYCDSPYNIGLDYNKGISGKNNYGGKTNDSKSNQEYLEFLRSTLKNGLAVLSPDAHIFYYCDQRYIGMVQALYQELSIKNQRVCLWIKNGFNVTPQVAFNKAYEPCVYGTIGKPYLSPLTQNLSELMNKEISTGNRTIDDILDIIDIWLAKRLPGQDYEHPTAKPPTLHEKALRRCTKPGDIVLDLFGGSGSTLIACEQLKRKAYLVEIEPIFCQLIINRFESYGTEKAKQLN